MSPSNYEPDGDVPSGKPAAQGPAEQRADPLPGNPYSAQYRADETPDLDAAAPQLRSHDLRRMNQRALLFLGAVIVLLLFVAYWMLSSTGKRVEPKAREEKVTITEAPNALAAPQLTPAPQLIPQQPSAQTDAIPLAPLPPMPPMPPMPDQSAQQQAAYTRLPSLVERRVAASDGGSGVADQLASLGQNAGQNSDIPGNAGGAAVTLAKPLTHPGTLMQRGTYIRCVLETHIVSDIPGFTSCLVTEPVYSFNGRTLLLPKGSKVLGSYGKQSEGRRMAVIWDRILTPNGIDVNMASPGIDNLGGAGLPGYYDAHWASRISSALLISMLSDAFKYEAAEKGPAATAVGPGVVSVQPFESNTARTMQNLADQAVQASANRAATITINQGTIIYVYVAKDVDFSGVVARF